MHHIFTNVQPNVSGTRIIYDSILYTILLYRKFNPRSVYLAVFKIGYWPIYLPYTVDLSIDTVHIERNTVSLVYRFRGRARSGPLLSGVLFTS